MEIQEITNIPPREIDLNCIETAEGPFTMSYGFDLTDLRRSISNAGIINCPILVKNRSGRMDIVVGYRRILAIKSLGKRSIFCIDLSDYNISPFRMLLLNLYDNLIVRKLNPVETGMLLRRLSLYLSQDDIRRDFLPILGISGKQDLGLYLRLEQADTGFKDSISRGELSLNAASILIDKDIGSRKSILKTISNLKMNFSYQFQFIDILEDISANENLHIHEIIISDEFQQILNDKKSNTPQKIKKIFHLLRSRKFPFLTVSEKIFKKRSAGLGLPSKVSINHPPFFEGRDYRLDILFKDGKELFEKLSAMLKIAGLKDIKDPWSAREE